MIKAEEMRAVTAAQAKNEYDRKYTESDLATIKSIEDGVLAKAKAGESVYAFQGNHPIPMRYMSELMQNGFLMLSTPKALYITW